MTSQPMVHGTLQNHMLWGILFMKVYAKETALCSLAGGVDEKTFRKWVWPVIYLISAMNSFVASHWLCVLMYVLHMQSRYLSFAYCRIF
jgi:hypothetical protein